MASEKSIPATPTNPRGRALRIAYGGTALFLAIGSCGVAVVVGDWAAGLTGIAFVSLGIAAAALFTGSAEYLPRGVPLTARERRLLSWGLVAATVLGVGLLVASTVLSPWWLVVPAGLAVLVGGYALALLLQ
jgi:hypothetical protein